MNKKSLDTNELQDWIDALDNLVLFNGKDDAKELINEFLKHVGKKGMLGEIYLTFPLKTQSHISRSQLIQAI